MKSFVIILTGVYGDVIRVKILFNKKDCALIQMAEPQHAQLGKFHSFICNESENVKDFCDKGAEPVE